MPIILTPIAMVLGRAVLVGLSCLLIGPLAIGYFTFWALMVSIGPLGLCILSAGLMCRSSNKVPSDVRSERVKPIPITAQVGQTSHFAYQPTWSTSFRKALIKAADRAGECQFKAVVWTTIEADKSYLVFTGEGPYPQLRDHIVPSKTLVILAPPSAATERRDPIDYVPEFSGDLVLKACTVITAQWQELQFIKRHGHLPERLLERMRGLSSCSSRGNPVFRRN